MFSFLKNIIKSLLKRFFATSKNLDELCELNSILKAKNQKPSTRANRQYLHKMLFANLEKTALNKLEKSNFINLIAKLQAKGLKSSTIKQILNYAKQGLELAKDLGYIRQNPIKNLKYQNKQHKSNKTIKLTNIKKLLHNSQGSLKTFLYFAFFTGARAGEILALNKDDIDYKKSLININKNATRYGITTPKNHESRQIPLAKELKTYLKNINFKSFDKDYFQIYYEFKKLKEKLGLSIGSIHSIRHTFASFCLYKKFDLNLIAKYLGHRDISMLSRVYSHEIYDKNELKKFKNLFYFKT